MNYAGESVIHQVTHQGLAINSLLSEMVILTK